MSVDAETRPEALRELGLARAELAPQADEVARLGRRAARRPPRARRVGAATSGDGRTGGRRPRRVGPGVGPPFGAVQTGRRRQTKRSRSPIGTATRPVPSEERPSPASRMDAAGEPARARPARPSVPSRPAQLAAADADEIGRRRRQGDVGGVEHERRRVADDRDLAAGERARGRRATGLGDRSPDGAVEHEDRERRQPVERRPLARLRREEVAPLLAGEPGDDDAADAHRPRPGERLGVDPRADDEDRAGQPDVEAARPQDAPGHRSPGPRRAPAARGSDSPRASTPGMARPLGPDADPDRPAGRRGRRRHGGLDGLGSARRRRPASGRPPVEEQLAHRARRTPGRSSGGSGAPAGGRPAIAGVGAPAGDGAAADLHEPRVAEAVEGPRAGAPACRAGRTERPRRPGRSAKRRRSGPLDDGPAPATKSGPASSRVARPHHRAVCQALSSSRRRSGRSGSRSGTSRRSTRSPPRPPATSTAKCRPAAPRRTASRNLNSATAVSPGGRSTSSRPPGTRSRSLDARLGVDRQRAGRSPGPHPGRRSRRSRAARAGRRRGRS